MLPVQTAVESHRLHTECDKLGIQHSLKLINPLLVADMDDPGCLLSVKNYELPLNLLTV